jgi:integrase
VGGETKTGEARTIRLPSSVKDALECHRAMQAEEKLAARSWDDPRLMFPNRRGGAHRRNSVMVIFRHHLDAAGLPRIRFHDLRHTAAVMMLNSGVPINVVSQVLGHKDPAMTLRRYAHVLSDAQQIAADKIDAYGF